jgi:hypothetical protein
MKSILALAGISMCCSCLFGQWEPDTRLTYDDSVSTTFLGYASSIAAEENTVVLTWQDNREGTWEIYAMRSTDHGVSWSMAERISDTRVNSEYPCIAMSNGFVHAAWHDMCDGNKEIYYSRSTDNGFSWETPFRITDDPNNSTMPSIAACGNDVYLVWNDDRSGLNDVYFTRSLDNGVTWEENTRITYAEMPSLYPAIAANDSCLHGVWARDWEIYHMRSIDKGITWEMENRLTNDPHLSLFASVALFGEQVHVVWHDQRNGNIDIYYTCSSDGGLTWEDERPLTTHVSSSNIPTCAAHGAYVHVAWYDNRDGNYEIYYTRSIDSGASWENETRLTAHDSISKAPSICVAGPCVHLVWQDNRDGNDEVYYKRNPTGSHCDENCSAGTIQSRVHVYPHPCSGNACIYILVPYISKGFPDACVCIYDVSGRLVRDISEDIVGQSVQGSMSVTKLVWDGHDYHNNAVSGGVYFVKCTINNNTQIEKIIVVK